MSFPVPLVMAQIWRGLNPEGGRLQVEVGGTLVASDVLQEEEGAPEIPWLFIEDPVTHLLVYELEHVEVIANLRDFEWGF